MKPLKFVAATAREALAKVRDGLGDDAVILSNRATSSGVEVVAIAEREFEALVESVEPGALPRKEARPSIAEQVASQIESTASARLAGYADRSVHSVPNAMGVAATPPAFPWESDTERKQFSFVDFVRGRRHDKSLHRGVGNTALAHQLVGAPPSMPARRIAEQPANVIEHRNTVIHGDQQRLAPKNDPTGASSEEVNKAPQVPHRALLTKESYFGGDHLDVQTRAPVADQAILDELKSLRGLMESRVDAPRSVTPSTQLVPAMLRRELLATGMHGSVVDAALQGLPTAYALAQAREWVETRLARALGCAAVDEDIIETGGIFALTGPTGVGKTTTAAKLAARCAVRYGAKSVGLITTDTYRIGAPDQLRIYGKILGVPVHTVHDFDWLHRTLDMLGDRRLVLIDTIGMGQRDVRVKENLDFLDGAQVKRLLLLAAPSQPETQEEVVEAYRGRSAIGAVLTKLDEAVKLAPALSVLLRFKLRLRYVANGQRVPEDLHIPDAANLIRASLLPNDRASVPGLPRADIRNSAKLAR